MASGSVSKKMRLAITLEETYLVNQDPVFKMLLIGETGSGKTSLINLFCNCALIEDTDTDQLQLNEMKEYNDILLEDPEAKKMESKTTGAKQYVTRLHKLDIGIIDTPGFGDTRGFDKDSENIEKIIQILKSTEYINCVCLVINGRSARLSPSIKYVLTEITTILPQEIVNNLIVVFSNTNDELELNFDAEELNRYFQNKILTDRFFYIENPYCKLLKAKTKQSLSVDTTQNLARSFMVTAAVLRRMYSVVKNFKPVHTFHFITLYDKKQEIEKNVIKILAKYDQQRELDIRIKHKQEEVEAALRAKKLYSNYKTTNKFKRYNLKDTEKYNIICAVPHCYSNCHISCHLEKSFDKESYRDCTSIQQNGYCTKCHHYYKYHYHSEVIFVEEDCEEELIDPIMKKDYQKCLKMEEKAKMLRQQLQKHKEQSKKEKERLSQELLIVLDQFHAKGMNRNYAKLLQTQIDTIELRLKDVDELDTTPLQKIKEELEIKLKIIQHALHEEPYGWSELEIQKKREWASSCLKLDSQSQDFMTEAQIRKAFIEVSKAYHPDKGGDSKHFERIQRAKDILLAMNHPVMNAEPCPFKDSNIVSSRFTCDGGLMFIEDYGVKVIIPKGAIENSCVEVQAAASLFAPFVVPDNCQDRKSVV